MRESPLQKIWANNKRFLLVTGAGLAVFLVVNALVSSFVGGADRMVEKASRLTEESRKLRRELKDVYGELRSRIADYEEHEAKLIEELSLPPMEQAAKLDKSALLVQFNEAIEKVWQEALAVANRRGVELPERLSPDDFSYSSEDGPDEFTRYYAYLAVTRRALIALLESGMDEVLRPELISEEFQPIAENGEDAAVMMRAVRFIASGPYDAWVNVLQSVQKRGDFLQVQILSLAPAKGASDGRLRGDVLFVALTLVRGDEAASGAGGKTKRGSASAPRARLRGR